MPSTDSTTKRRAKRPLSARVTRPVAAKIVKKIAWKGPRRKRKTATNATKAARFDVRVSDEIRDAVVRAADIEGRSISDFMVSALRAASERVFVAHERTILTAKDRAVFFDALATPPRPSQRLADAVRRYRKQVRTA